MASELLQLLSVSGVEEETDPFFNQVTGLYHFDGSNGGTNATFIDSSTSGHTVTNNGDVTQGTFSPFSVADGNWSVIFPGNTAGYLSNTNTMTAVGNGDFTIEFWAMRTDTNNGGFFQYTASPLDVKSGALGLGIYNDEYYLYYGTSGALAGRAVSSSGIPGQGVWFHVAYVRSSGTITIYTDGTAVTTQASTTNYTDVSFTLGGYYSSSFLFGGYISNFRVVKGTAVYTSNFTPPTTPLTAISGTILLTAQSNRFVDNSSEAETLTVLGAATLPPKILPFSPFAKSPAYSAASNGGSGYFDRTGDYLSAQDSDFAFGTGDFTVEGWVRLNGWSTGTGSGRGIFHITTGYLNSTVYGPALGVDDSGNWHIYHVSGATALAYGPIANEWTHFVYVRNSSTSTVYLDGVSVWTASDSNDYTWSHLVVGGYYSSSFLLDGYISDFRIVKGTAVYTSAFTPPTAPLTAISGTELLLSFTNGSAFDNSSKTLSETTGSVQLSTSIKKFGTAGLDLVGGTGNRLALPPNPLFNVLNTGKFTIEFFLYVEAYHASYSDIVGVFNGVSAGWLIYQNGGNLDVYINGSQIITGSRPSTDAWHHIALTRDGTSLKLFVDGTQLGSTSTASLGADQTAYGLVFGGDATGRNGIEGHIDEFRLTFGKARYISNFVPAAKSFPNAGKPLASGTIAVTYVIISGGGGGGKQGGALGQSGGGGGGAGGVVTGTANISSGTAVTVTVGAGGAGITGNVSTQGNDGTASSIATISTTSVAGGGGARGVWPTDIDGNDGGSGGGACNGGTPGSGTSGQGNDGGNGTSSSEYGGGGGGGAGSVGGNAGSTRAGAGGSGTSAYSAWATATSTGDGGLYAGGGGGSGYQNAGTQGLAGSGGGGQGGSDADVAAAGDANTGGGGGAGGGRAGTYPSAAGGSGIVMIRYAGSQAATGGSVVTTGGFTYHTFITSGTFTNN